jgi:hypothetical protein
MSSRGASVETDIEPSLQLLFNNRTVNSYDNLEIEKSLVAKEISNIKLVMSWIPRGQINVPESIELEQTDRDLLHLCKFNEVSLSSKLERKEIELTSMEQRLSAIVQQRLSACTYPPKCMLINFS